MAELTAAKWTYTPSAPSLPTRVKRLRRWLMHRRPPPAWKAITPIVCGPRWIVYFVFLPHGRLSSAHRFTLARLRDEDAALAIVCAAPSADLIPRELRAAGDALYWKALGGFDFSAYAIAVAETARHSPDAELTLLNDSVLGPFGGLRDSFARAPWDVAGLTGASYFENHIQSYAWRIRSLSSVLADSLRPVLGGGYAFERFEDVVACQETRLARCAARAASVGALWFSDYKRGGGDLTLLAPLAMLDAGLPFLKRSLFGKFAACYDQIPLLARLRSLGHPAPDAH